MIRCKKVLYKKKECDFMNIIDIIESEVKTKINEYKINAEDHYDFWNEHIKYVYVESQKLAVEYGADIIANFDNIPMLFNSAYNRNHIALNEVREWMKNTFEKDYNDLSDKTKESFKGC